MNLVQKIRTLCNIKKLTFAELERILDISNGQIKRWEKAAPSIYKVQKVADYFDVSVDYLLGREKEKYSGEESIDPLSIFSDKEEFYKLSEKEQEIILNSLRDQADYLIYKYKTKKDKK
ncbi:helix-turn-helix domain-containing protein [Staphylococcus borealis]|uniref:helix-turn-helix domain-containing protein n=1 Tax=Staphylococcus borealis TaxID=2742203 RepID=UPI002DBE7699|nr:helix-turn-helix transcriptional regulator [Staphylococcus borealis]